MIREYAEEEIARNREEPPEYAHWAGEMTGTDRYAAMRIVRQLRLRDTRDTRIAEQVCAAYSVTADIQGAAERARERWNQHRSASELHDYLGIPLLKRIGDRVDQFGLAPLLDAIPETH